MGDNCLCDFQSTKGIADSEQKNDLEQENKNTEQELRWYAMRATFKRELVAKQLLDDVEVENYIPMREVTRIARGRRVTFHEPAIHNLIFVRWTKDALQSFKRRVPYLQYLTSRCGNDNVPITVADGDMNSFIALSSSDELSREYYDPSMADIKSGMRVRITGGTLSGVEGYYVKIKGKRNKRVLVSIDNVVAVATAAVKPDMIEVIEK